MYDLLYMVCVCGGAKGQEGFLRTKQRMTPDQIYIEREIFECSHQEQGFENHAW